MTERIRITVDGAEVTAYADQPLGAVLHGLGRPLRTSPQRRAPRGLFCGMGVCFECAVTVDGAAQVRACVTPARDGMVVETGS
jgi:aerobic-type carbon monoxide dehydrogenase small subunit (CoxS/CutS family)